MIGVTRAQEPGVSPDHADCSDPGIWKHLAAAAARHDPSAGRQASWVRCEPGWAWHYPIPDFDLWAVPSGTAGVVRIPEGRRLEIFGSEGKDVSC